MDEQKVKACVQSWVNHAGHGDTTGLRRAAPEFKRTSRRLFLRHSTCKSKACGTLFSMPKQDDTLYPQIHNLLDPLARVVRASSPRRILRFLRSGF
ncbi:MAG: hypothetical protein QMD04_13500 [Anaerolineales bacterium]|nr:hypothetical protein [Anaerolineales bacterium]